MHQAAQVRQAKRLLDLIEAGATDMASSVYRNPVADYTCKTQLAEERRRLFGRLPLVMGLRCDLPEPGDYLSCDFSGTPLLMVRDRDGSVRAFLNVCRHRGSRLAQGCGHVGRVLTCPYHGWSYGLDGRLAGVPHPEGFAELDRAAHGLVPLPALEWHGLLCAVPDAEADTDIAAHLEPLAGDFASYGLDGYHHFETRVLRKPLNWKLVMDTFQEVYHLPVLHRNTVNPILHGYTAAFDAMGPHLRLIAARRGIDALHGEPESQWDLIRHTAIVYIMFPNTVLIMQGDHVETWRVFPSGESPDESVMYVSLYTPEPATTEKAKRHWERNMDLLLRTVEEEDFPMAAGMQRNFHSGAQAHVTFGRNEPALAHFHGTVRRYLQVP